MAVEHASNDPADTAFNGSDEFGQAVTIDPRSESMLVVLILIFVLALLFAILW